MFDKFGEFDSHTELNEAAVGQLEQKDYEALFELAAENGIDREEAQDYHAVMNYARITPPTVKENYVDIAGGDSAIDLTEAVGGIVFEDGKIEFKFTLLEENDKIRMKNELHGKRMQITLESDSSFYYDGRLLFTKEERIGSSFELYMEARVKPYKYAKRETIHIEEVNGKTAEIVILNSRMPAMPRITVAGNVYLKYEDAGYALRTGTYEIPEITFYEGYNRIIVSGNGSIRFEYRKGQLI